ncbi:CoA pyrophosphatase [Frigidibacter sp. RF13]|uniref:NUDIX hydrolase n=1 Tax=Frigidibacter sp. RF13 TaxID=2997340 RepID=UPI00226E58C4|nr:CoA pyrophosphatase [Frigidibacter sp. RF13]MCY1126742.1 CoA pyrophosphatase [Frigidibacter sp. RF13]
MPPSDLAIRLGQAIARPGRDTSDYDLNPGTVLPEGRLLRPAAVLVGFQRDRVILTKRASHLKHHPGQIAFPGGKVDAADGTGEDGLIRAALREAEEEIGLLPQQARIIGALAPHETVTGFTVTPVLAEIDPDFAPRPQEEEVEEVFAVPYTHLADPAHFRVESRLWRGQRRHYFTVPYGPYYIWGATARILRALADRMAA